MQETTSNLALAVDSTAVMAIRVRAECRGLRGDLYGALKDFQELQKLGHNVSKVCLLLHNISIHVGIAPACSNYYIIASFTSCLTSCNCFIRRLQALRHVDRD